MKSTFISSLTQAWQLIKKDPIILIPNILLLLTVHLMIIAANYYLNMTPASLLKSGLIGKLAGLQWLNDLLFNGLCVLMVLQLQSHDRLNFQKLAIQLIRHLPRLVAFTAPIGLAFWFLIWKALPTTLPKIEAMLPSQIAALVAAGFLSLLLAILPPIIILGRPSLPTILSRLGLLFRPHFWRVFLFGLMTLNFGFLIIICSVLSASIPVIGDSILSSAIEGAGTCSLYLSWVIFYQSLLAESWTTSLLTPSAGNPPAD